MTPAQAKKLIETIEKSKTKIAAERDKLRIIMSDLEGLEDTCDRGCEALEEAIDALSELL
jgi:hypothetical protein